VSSPDRIGFRISPASRRTAAAERDRLLADPGFGRIFTEHLVSIHWDAKRGWHDAALRPYAPVQFDPGTVFLHYAQGVFEGLKAFRQTGGGVAVFRPDAHAARFRRSARRLALPELPEEAFVEAIELLLQHDHEWTPSGPGKSLYLRPFMYASDVGLGVRAAQSVTFLLIASPSGSYFPGGVEPVSVWLSEDYTRAAPGGTGEAKCGGNYAGSLLAQAQAAREGCDSVVWLDAAEHAWVEELSGMNLFLVFGGGAHARLVTPALTGTLVAGITRDSLLRLGADLGYGVEERRVSVEEWKRGCADGSVTEVFACGTAAVITPVGEVKSANHGHWSVAGGSPGPITMRLHQALVDIQRGSVRDPHGWMHAVPVVG
jgi:branched-chain amino acid aminotransferase